MAKTKTNRAEQPAATAQQLGSLIKSARDIMRKPPSIPSIPTNLLFFDRTGPTKTIWYYEQPLPEGRKNYTKRD